MREVGINECLLRGQYGSLFPPQNIIKKIYLLFLSQN